MLSFSLPSLLPFFLGHAKEAQAPGYCVIPQVHDGVITD
jgi:hypothetical protein